MQISVRDNIPSNCSDTRSLLRYMSNDDYSITSRFDAAPASPLPIDNLMAGRWRSFYAREFGAISADEIFAELLLTLKESI